MKAYNARPEVRDRAAKRQSAAWCTPLGRAQALVRSVRWRSKKCQLPFDLNVNEIAYTIENCMCPYTMQPFVLVNGRHPFAPSIDRSDNDKGYTRSNVQVVSLWWNIAKNEWPQEVTATVLLGLKRSLQDMEFG